MIMTAFQTTYTAVGTHTAPDDGVCHLMAHHADPDRTHHERMITIGQAPVVTWTARAADTCPDLDGVGVYDCLGCDTRRQPGTQADAHAHAEQCATGGAR